MIWKKNIMHSKGSTGPLSKFLPFPNLVPTLNLEQEFILLSTDSPGELRRTPHCKTHTPSYLSVQFPTSLAVLERRFLLLGLSRLSASSEAAEDVRIADISCKTVAIYSRNRPAGLAVPHYVALRNDGCFLTFSSRLSCGFLLPAYPIPPV